MLNAPQLSGSDLPLDLDELQAAMYQTVAEFATKELAPHAVEWDRDHHFPVDVLRKSAALGCGGIWVDEEYGGSGLTRHDGVVIFEAMSTADPSLAAYVSIHNMCAGMIDKWGTTDQRARYLAELCAMEKLASYCLTEPDAGSDAAALRTTAKRDGDDYVLNGVKQFISGAGSTQVYIVMARTNDGGGGGGGARGITAFIVDHGTDGLTFGPNEHKMGWNAQPTRQVLLDDVRIPASQRLGDEGSGFKIALAGLDGGRLNISACSIGGAAAATEAARQHLTERQAFGGPLANQQHLRFKLAEMQTTLESSRLMVRRAATAVDAGAADATQWAAMAKLVATDGCFDVANQALQMFGGYGYLAETGIEKIVRDLRVHQILEGTNEIMRLIISRSLLAGSGRR